MGFAQVFYKIDIGLFKLSFNLAHNHNLFSSLLSLLSKSRSWHKPYFFSLWNHCYLNVYIFLSFQDKKIRKNKQFSLVVE